MHTINMIITNKNNNWYYYIKVQLIKRIVKAFGNASNLKKKKKKVRLYWHDLSKSFITYIALKIPLIEYITHK